MLLKNLSRNFKELSKFINWMILGGSEVSECDGVNLLSVHASKSLEFKAVNDIDLMDGRFPNRKLMSKGGSLEEEPARDDSQPRKKIKLSKQATLAELVHYLVENCKAHAKVSMTLWTNQHQYDRRLTLRMMKRKRMTKRKSMSFLRRSVHVDSIARKLPANVYLVLAFGCNDNPKRNNC